MTELETLSHQDALSALKWQIAMGVDECIEDLSLDRFALTAAREEQKKQAVKSVLTSNNSPTGKPPRGDTGQSSVRARGTSTPAALLQMGSEAEAKSAANAATDLASLFEALKNFDGGTIQKGAKNCVFAEGIEDASLMVIGESPEAEDDRSGRPFSGPGGTLLDKILAAIGHSRNDNTRVTHIVPWRSLGNREPDPATLAVFRPFLEKHIELVKPKIIISVGKIPTNLLSNRTESISRLRGKFMEHSINGHSFALMPTYKMDQLMRAPATKGQIWPDMLAVMKRLKEL